MKRDRFKTASRLAERMEYSTPPDPKDLMRPKSASQRREEEYRDVVFRREFSRRMAEDAIIRAMSRILWPKEYGTPTTFDALILCQMDDDDIDMYVGQQVDYDRLVRFRDNLREKIS